jgi:hypothetical protein
MIGGKRAGGDGQSPLLVRSGLYRTPVGVISGFILFRFSSVLGPVSDGLVCPLTLQTTSIVRPGNAAAAPLHRTFPIY